MILTTTERQKLLDFIGRHADGDILLQVANRILSNRETMKEVNAFKASPVPEVRAAHELTEAPEKHKDEDLGPAPSKLGANGQRILKAMEDEKSFSVKDVIKMTGLPRSKITPQMALMLERKLIARITHDTYRVLP